MIKIPVRIDITDGTAPFTFYYKSTDDAATFSPATGTAVKSGNIYICNTTVQYPTAASVNAGIITCDVIDGGGCIQTLSPVVINNPCTLQGSISTNGEFVFVATVSGGSGQYKYTWTFDSSVFTLNDTTPTDNVLSLTSNGVLPNTTPIQCVVEDKIYGCLLVLSYSYNVCAPIAGNVAINMVCNSKPLPNCGAITPASQYIDYNLTQSVRPCTNQVINWNTVEFSSVSNVCITNNNGIIRIVTSLTTAQVVNVLYRVKTVTGIASNWGTIILRIPNCILPTALSAVPDSIQLIATDAVNDVKTTKVDSRIGGTPLWNTFQFTNTPTFGTVSINPNKEIEYTIADNTTTTNIPDTIKWSLQDSNGNQVNITDVVFRDAIPAPVTTVETICATCNTSVGPIDVLANDTGDIDRSTLTITLNDPDLIITKDSNNNLNITALPGASFSNLSRYKVANTQGCYSGEQGFYVSVACAGSDKTVTKDVTCDISKSFDIKDQFTGVNAFNIAYVESGLGTPYTTAGGTIVGADGTLDFTLIPYGTYEFEMTAENIVACSPAYDDLGTLTVVHGAPPSITIGTPVLVAVGIYNIPFTYNGITSSFNVTDDGSIANFHTGIMISGGSGTFTLYATAGSVIIVSATTQCGVTTSDTVVL